MENLLGLSGEGLKETDEGVVIEVLSFAVLWCCYELGSVCKRYDKRHNL